LLIQSDPEAMEGLMTRQAGFFDLDERYAALSKGGDPLVRLSAVVDFEIFRADLNAALTRSDRSKGGRPPFDAVLMFKVLILQALYGLADEQTEFQVRDRLSFMRFLGLDLHGLVPDARTIWLFREHLTKAGAIDALCASYQHHSQGGHEAEFHLTSRRASATYRAVTSQNCTIGLAAGTTGSSDLVVEERFDMECLCAIAKSSPLAQPAS
jgi:hypothetical protein